MEVPEHGNDKRTRVRGRRDEATVDFSVKGLEHELVLLAVHRAVRHRREVLAKREEVAQLRSRIAELEAGRPDA
jgi:FixJ family two-component response regulator